MEETELNRGLARLAGKPGSVGGANSRSVVGGGCLIGPDVVLTCAHVVEKALGVPGLGASLQDRPTEAVFVDFPHWPEAKPIKAFVVEGGWFPPDGERGDVAVLKLQGRPPAGARHPPFRRPPSMMDHGFHVEGFPDRIGDAWAVGLIRGETHGGSWVQLETTSAAGHEIETGFSGAPVWDDEVEAVVGIVVIVETDSSARAARMIPMSALARMWPPLKQRIGWRLRFETGELRRHWGPRARGLQRGRNSNSPWLFTGRVRAMRAIVEWLGQGDGQSGLIVTGGPGSGKSAVISRVVTLADDHLRNETPTDSAPAGTLPEPGAIDVAVQAKGKTLDMVVAKIAGGLDLRAGSAEDLVAELADGERPRTIVVDALDEAIDTTGIATRLLQPLATDGRDAGIKVLIGTRSGHNSSLLRKLIGMKIIDLDDRDEFLDDQDLVDYVRSFLLEGGGARPSPYAGQGQLAGRVAQAIARRAAPSFLLAQLVSHSLLARREVVDLTQHDWERGIPDDVGSVMEEYLSRFGEHERRVRDLFRPLAFAEGAGLPREDGLWATVAAGLAQRSYADDDVAWLLDSPAADYLVEGGGEAGRSGPFRLYHDVLAEYLRSVEDRGEAAIHGSWVEILLERLPRRAGGEPDWKAAGAYTRVHLAAHAAKAGRLDELLTDPGFLLAAEPARLVRALPNAASEDAVLAAGVFRRAAAQIRDCAPDEAASYLGLHAYQADAADLARRVGELGIERRWATRWARWLAPDAYLAIGQHGADVTAIAACVVDEVPIAVSGGDDGTLRIWNLIASQAISPALEAHKGRISAIATGTVDDEPVAVSGGLDHKLCMWDLRSGTRLGDPLSGHERPVTQVAMGELDGSPIAISASWDNTLCVWDLDARKLLGEPIRAHSRGATAVALGDLDGTPIAVSAGYETVRLWDLHSRQALHREPLRRHLGGVSAVALGSLDGKPIAVSAGWDQRLWAWDLRAYAPLGEDPIGSHAGGITAVAFDDEAGPAVVSGAEDGTVRTWDLHTGDSQAIEVGAAVFAVALGTVEGQRVAVCGGEGGSVRVWDLQARSPSTASGTARGRLTSVATNDKDLATVATGGDDGTVSTWDRDGQMIAQLEGGSPVFAVAIAGLDDRQMLLSGGWDGVIWMSDARSREPVRETLGRQSAWIAALATGELAGRPIAASGGADGSLRMWDLRTREQLAELPGHDGTITGVQIAEVAGAPLAVTSSTDGTVCAWYLADTRPQPTLLGAHCDEALAVAFGTVDGVPVAVSGGLDGAVRIWDLQGRELHRLETHSASVTAVALMDAGGGPLVIAGGDNGYLRVWNPRDGATSSIEIGSPISGLAAGEGTTCITACTRGLAVIDLLEGTQSCVRRDLPRSGGAVTGIARAVEISPKDWSSTRRGGTRRARSSTTTR